MTYASIDILQKALQKEYWGNSQDGKKAAGRALGTIIEIITFYIIESWKLSQHLAIEKGIAEFGNADITHNVEYTLHPIYKIHKLKIPFDEKTLSAKKIMKLWFELPSLPDKISIADYDIKNNTLLTKRNILRNACTLATKKDKTTQLICTNIVVDYKNKMYIIQVSEQLMQPFALFECKRVGVEEGTKKGPQTIEKAKQGAYVAKMVSALQKIRTAEGKIKGILFNGDDKPYVGDYELMIKKILDSGDINSLKRFVLTIGVVSNHGNWFTREIQNKELKVLAQSYDWLLFLTDSGLAKFIEELILKRNKAYPAIHDSFKASYGPDKITNEFTKVQMNYNSHLQLIKYFKDNLKKVDSWFNIISPREGSLKSLNKQLVMLSRKNWSVIHDCRKKH